MDYMLLPLKRYADFSGRSRRMEFWMFTLFIFGVSLVATIIEMVLGIDEAIAPDLGPLSLLITLATLIPSLAVMVRRLHDQDKSGWWALMLLIPLIGALVLLVMMFLEGTQGPNRFGPDPKAY